MLFIECCIESERQNGCMATEWLETYQLYTLMIAWLIGSLCSPPLPSITREHLPHVVSLGKDQNSSSGFYPIHIVLISLWSKQTKTKSKHHKLGAFWIGKQLYIHPKNTDNSMNIMFIRLAIKPYSFYQTTCPGEAQFWSTLRMPLHMWAEKSSSTIWEVREDLFYQWATNLCVC